MPEPDPDLIRFEAEGAPALHDGEAGHVEYEGARIWFGSYGSGPAVVLLHGAFDNSEDWGYQVPALTAAGYRVIAIDSRGRGRSTLGPQPLTFALLSEEALRVLDTLGLEQAAFVGWSDGGVIALELAMRHPERVKRVFAFGVAADLTGLKEFEQTPLLDRVFGRAKRDHARLSPEPEGFAATAAQVNRLDETEPNYSAAELAGIRVPITVVRGEQDEFIRPEHTEYLAATIPGARHVILPGVSHFAMLQRPDDFNRAVLDFLGAQ